MTRANSAPVCYTIQSCTHELERLVEGVPFEVLDQERDGIGIDPCLATVVAGSEPVSAHLRRMNAHSASKGYPGLSLSDKPISDPVSLTTRTLENNVPRSLSTNNLKRLSGASSTESVAAVTPL
jgi:hypothetical protein